MNAYSVQLILDKLVNRHTLRNAFQRIEDNRVMRYYKIGFVRHCLFYHIVGYVKAKAYTLNRGIHITDKKSAVVKLILHRKRCVFIQKLVDSAYFHNLHPKNHNVVIIFSISCAVLHSFSLFAVSDDEQHSPACLSLRHTRLRYSLSVTFPEYAKASVISRLSPS